ncbi:MAG TPA: hypothetical protein VGH89_35570 [Pseudonocardia sp.]
MSSRVSALIAPGCPTEAEHRFEIGLGAAGVVAGLTLHCPNCAGQGASSPADELTEIVAARRRTMAGLAGLPERTRADLDASGTLSRLYQSTVAEVRDAAERCRAQFGGELPAGLRAARPGAADRRQAAAVLDAAADWLARFTARPAH